MRHGIGGTDRNQTGQPREGIRDSAPIRTPASLGAPPWKSTGLSLAGGVYLVYTARWNRRVKREIPAKPYLASSGSGSGLRGAGFYVPSFDGVRALSIIAVVASHVKTPFFHL